ncbi:hypothetical protein DSECCO2_307080 [anaerobic digester metagenome]
MLAVAVDTVNDWVSQMVASVPALAVAVGTRVRIMASAAGVLQGLTAFPVRVRVTLPKVKSAILGV